MRRQKTIGLLGLDSRSTAYYYERLSPCTEGHELSVEFINFNKINELLPDKFDRIAPLLQSGLNKLRRCDIAIIPNITLHETFDRLDKSELHVSVTHAVKETAAYLRTKKIERLALFGSYYTMNSPYWTSILDRHGISKIDVPEDIMRNIDNFRQKVFANEQSELDVIGFKNHISTFTQSCHVVLACTELSPYSPKGLRSVTDAVDIHISKAISRANSVTC